MRKIYILLLSIVMLLTAGCSHAAPDVLNSPEAYEEFPADIYLCTDVYRTKDTPTHGSGVLALPMAQDVFKLADYQLLLCDDNCSPASVVSRASQGYAISYEVVSDGELDGNFKILKFKMEIPAELAEILNAQGNYEEIKERLERNHYYLLVLDETHYAYIHLERKEDAEGIVQEAALADSIVEDAVILFETENK